MVDLFKATQHDIESLGEDGFSMRMGLASIFIWRTTDRGCGLQVTDNADIFFHGEWKAVEMVNVSNFIRKILV